ncbi:MAG: hypothetical protein JXA87_12605 [Thermoleophilia bacterium]|nr:hypothetical protein [Thermoleophilia bacterium]
MVAVLLAALLATSASVAVLIARSPAAARAAGAPLTVSIDQPLTLVGEPFVVTIVGDTAESLIGSKLVVRIKGPAELSQIGQVAPELPEANKVVVTLGTSASTTTTTTIGAVATTATSETGTSGETTTPTGPAVTTTTVPATTTTTVSARVGADAALEAGVLKAEVMVPARTPARAGAYLVVVEVKEGAEVVASGQAWIGKAEPRETPLDLAFVWPVSLGIHRDPEGVFYDQVLEEAVAPMATGAGDLRGLLGLTGKFNDWDFTLAVEPVLLTQLRDMADGYSRVDASGTRTEVTSEDPPAKNAAEVLTAFKGLGGDQSLEIAVIPYSGADLGVLAARGWRDGFEQIQMGKQEIQQTMSLQAPLTGGYPPDLRLTTESLGFYAEASIDHLVVDAGLTELLTEPLAEGTVAVRARDADNDRVTLVFASSALSSHMTAPWDPGVFSAALAAELASREKTAIVVSPRLEFSLVPEAYLDGLGKILEGTAWIRPRTLTALLREHTPDTRPILLKTPTDENSGYIEESLLSALEAAHTAVTDLATVADTTRIPVEAAHRSLYMAQSRWWSRADTSPREASIGLDYAKQAQALAQAELDKIRLVGVGPTRMIGSRGIVTVTAQNDTGYPVKVGLRLDGSGLASPAGGLSEIELPVGQTEIPVEVEKAEAPHRLEVTLMAGNSPLDEASHPLSFITITTVLPWILIGAVVVAVALFLLIRWLLRRRHAIRAV